MSYRSELLDKSNSRSHAGSMDKNDKNVGTALIGKPSCGDVMKLQIRVENGKIAEAKFKTFGCGAAIASSAYAAEIMEGRGVEEALKIKNTDIVEYLGLPPVKIHCSCLAEEAIKAAVADYQAKQDKRDQMFQVTFEAAQYLKTFERDSFKISTKSHGCSGVSYQLDVADSNLGLECVAAHGIKVFVDPQAAMFVIGMTVGYEARDDWEGLVFKNPNEVGRCKCGESFYVS